MYLCLLFVVAHVLDFLKEKKGKTYGFGVTPTNEFSYEDHDAESLLMRQ
jgi:hypothetical protein